MTVRESLTIYLGDHLELTHDGRVFRFVGVATELAGTDETQILLNPVACPSGMYSFGIQPPPTVVLRDLRAGHVRLLDADRNPVKLLTLDTDDTLTVSLRTAAR